MDSNTIILALAATISTLAGLYGQELRSSRDAYKEETREYRDQLKLNTEAMRELSAFVRDTVPLLAEFRVMLPTLRDLIEDRDDPPLPPARVSRTRAK